MSDMPQYKKKDFMSDQEVRWCPGCGDYTILAAVQNAMPKIGKKKEDIVFVSGIGCSSRFPYYMNTYGMHTIHGRAPGFASGVKITNPNLAVWLITGDGDGLSIGANHFAQLIRRNIDIKVILFNNEIYGLTKGQFSPTSTLGLKTPTTPYGNIDRPFKVGSFAIGSESTFFARTIDTDVKHMQEVVLAASKHKGTAIIEVFQNCVIFNDGVHDEYTNKTTRDDSTLRLEHGKPMIFGKESNKGIMLEGLTPKVVTIGENGISEKDLLVHDALTADPTLAFVLSRLNGPDFPVPIGIFRSYQVPGDTYEVSVTKQIESVKEQKGPGSMEKLLMSGETWKVS